MFSISLYTYNARVCNLLLLFRTQGFSYAFAYHVYTVPETTSFCYLFLLCFGPCLSLKTKVRIENQLIAVIFSMCSVLRKHVNYCFAPPIALVMAIALPLENHPSSWKPFKSLQKKRHTSTTNTVFIKQQHFFPAWSLTKPERNNSNRILNI